MSGKPTKWKFEATILGDVIVEGVKRHRKGDILKVKGFYYSGERDKNVVLVGDVRGACTRTSVPVDLVEVKMSDENIPELKKHIRPDIVEGTLLRVQTRSPGDPYGICLWEVLAVGEGNAACVLLASTGRDKARKGLTVQESLDRIHHEVVEGITEVIPADKRKEALDSLGVGI